MLKVRQICCQTILNKSDISDFTLNCYVGCSHKCLYCYAYYMKKFKNRPEPWGEFVDVKINAPCVLDKEIKKLSSPRKQKSLQGQQVLWEEQGIYSKERLGSEELLGKREVFMSSVCDPWQPIEAKYRLSRACLKLLLEAGFQVSILTKSSLILRDFDLLSAYKTLSLGMTITTVNQTLQKVLEPDASAVQERLNTLKKASEKGIKTWVFLGPLLPEFTDTPANLKAIFQALKGLNLTEIYVDKLNLRWGVLESLNRGLKTRDYTRLKLLLYKCNNSARYSQYCQQLKATAQEYAFQSGLSKKLQFCF